MSVIFHVLKEEFDRLVETETSYEKAISEMPKGSPRIRKVRDREYLYLEYRMGDHIIHTYIGPQDCEKTREILEKVAQRKRYEKLLKETKSALKDVKKALRGKV